MPSARTARPPQTPTAANGLGRRALLAGFGGVLAAPAIIRPALAAPERILRIACSSTRASTSGIGCDVFAARVAALTGGRLRVDVYPGSSVGGDTEATEALALGSLDVTVIAPSLMEAYGAQIGLFDMLYLFRDVHHGRAVLDGPMGTESLEWLKPRGILGLAWGENGLRHMTANRPVRNPDDLRNLRLRVPTSAIELAGFRSLGANAMQLGFSDVYMALSSGRLEAQENPIGTLEAARLQDVQTTLSLTGHIYCPYMIAMSVSVYDALAPRDQEVVREAARDAAAATRQAADDGEKKGIGRLQAAGMTVVGDVDKPAFMTALQPFTATMTEKFGRQRIEAIRATA